MAAIVGKRITQQDSPDSPKLPPQTKATSPFLYMAHPHRWQFIDATGEWLPLLGKLKVDPGVGGVLEGGGTDLAVAARTRKGWQIIQPSDERLGKFRWYVQRIPKAGKGVVHCDASESVEVVGNRAFWSEGGEQFQQFMRHLITSGILAPMNPRVRHMNIERQKQRVDRMESAAANAPHNQVIGARLTTALKLLKAMSADTADPQPPPTPTVVSKPKGKGKA